MEISMKNICRTCMNKESEMVSIFESIIEDIEDKTLADILMNFTSIQLNEDDGLPTLICQHCIKQLTIAFNFKKQSEEIDATLREITKNPNIEFIKQEILESDYEIVESETYETELQFEEILENVEIVDDSNSTNDENVDVKLEEVSQIEYSCVICLKTFTKYGHFIKHKKIHCADNYVCKECDISFKTKHEYMRHKRIHSKLFKCKLCTKEFRSSHGLSYHMKIHNGIKNFFCPFENCNKKFALKQGLDKHICIHSKDGNHLCYLCGKMYSTSDALHYHIKTHEGLRPHLCVHCGKTFKQMCHLKSHMWIHNGIKPHKCKSCGKCYTSGHQLKKHLRKYCNNFTIETT